MKVLPSPWPVFVMLPSASLLATIALAVAAVGSPVFEGHAGETLAKRASPITLPVSKKLNTTTGPITALLQRDQARAKVLRARGSAKGPFKEAPIVGSLPATNGAVQYTAVLNVGNPPTAYTLQVDTGSSNTWVGATKPYIQTSTSIQTRDQFFVIYGSGASARGTEFNDHVSLGSSLQVVGQSIGAATQQTGFDDVDGVLGLGPNGLTIGTLSPDTTQIIPTVTDNLFSQAVISQNLLSVSFEPTTTIGNVNGELTFGGTDSSKFVGSINNVPITRTSPANGFWGIDLSIRSGTTSILSQTAGIVDTGTTLTLIATDAFKRYLQITGGAVDPVTTLVKISPAQFANLKSLFFTINNVDYEFTANAQAWPRALNGAIGGDANSVYLIVGDIGSNSGSGFDFILGFTWLERFYSVYDTANRRVGLANTPFTRATTN
ncbi:aspartic protease [Panus rudis PR-1116 ss-1]|nr:aspartic protease [Panus rudis PR-1116 ss-1]